MCGRMYIQQLKKLCEEKEAETEDLLMAMTTRSQSRKDTMPEKQIQSEELSEQSESDVENLVDDESDQSESNAQGLEKLRKPTRDSTSLMNCFKQRETLHLNCLEQGSGLPDSSELEQKTPQLKRRTLVKFRPLTLRSRSGKKTKTLLV